MVARVYLVEFDKNKLDTYADDSVLYKHGRTLDTAALQNVIDNGGVVPPGAYSIDHPLILHSRHALLGCGEELVTIQTSGGFSGTEMVQLCDSTTAFVAVRSIGFASSIPGVAAIRQVGTTSVANSKFTDLKLNVAYGLILDSYTQQCDIDNIYSTGPIERLLKVSGNTNMISNLDQENDCGTTTEPMVHLCNVDGNPASDGNHFKNILLEGKGNYAKLPMLLDGVGDTVIEDLWVETIASTGYHLWIKACGRTELRQGFKTLNGTTGKIKITNSRETVVSSASLISSNCTLADVFDVDSASHVTIRELLSMEGSDYYRLDQLGRNFSVEKTYNRLTAFENQVGHVPTNALHFAGANRLVNPSFEAGTYGWSFSETPTTTESVASAVGSGLAMRVLWGATGQCELLQNTEISSAQVGIPLTFTALVNCIAGTVVGGGVVVLARGAGLYAAPYNQAGIGAGWQVLTHTVIPQAAGTLAIGFLASANVEMIVDECSLTLGTVSVPNQSNFTSIEIGGNTFATGTAAPTTGTWKQGDHVANSAPAVGQPKGWYCTVAGNSGTWVSEGNL